MERAYQKILYPVQLFLSAKQKTDNFTLVSRKPIAITVYPIEYIEFQKPIAEWNSRRDRPSVLSDLRRGAQNRRLPACVI